MIEKKDSLSKAQKRLRIVIIIGLIFTGIIVLRYGMLMLFPAEPALQDPVAFPAIERGPILDRNGELLAITTRLNSVTLWGPHVKRPRESASLLAKILRLEEQDIYDKLVNTSGFAYIKRKISPTESQQVRELMRTGKLQGINLEEEFGRSYPRKELASHVLGYVGTDNIGLDGIEYTFNEVLSPTVMGDNSDRIQGNTVYLTLDMNIQYKADKLAQKAMEEHDADSVMLIVAGAQTGEILALSSYPNFDPNTYGQYDQSAWNNRPITNTYEPGSVFKVFTIASFLQNNAIDESSIFHCDGDYDFNLPSGEVEHINCLGTHGWVNPGTILKYSCNTGAGKASETISPEDLYNSLIRFGFGNKTGLPLLGESRGIISKPQAWSYRTKATIAMGQEIGVSAVQVVSAATTFANGGVLLKPLVVKKLVSPQGEIIQEYKKTSVREVLSPTIATRILEMMEGGSQEGGTGRRARIDGLRLGIKTGTAERIDPETGKYSENEYVASALSIFPLPSPQLIIYIVIGNPKGESHFGGVIAAPIIKEMAEYLTTYLNIPLAGDTLLKHSGEIKISKNRQAIIEDKMPDFTGWSKRELLPLLSRADLRVDILGNGWVVRQSPAPGTLIKENHSIRLELE